MTPKEFEAIAYSALNGRGWQRSWCRGTGQSPSTLNRYLKGEFPIPQYVVVIVEMLATLRRHQLPLPDAFSGEPDITSSRLPEQDEPDPDPLAGGLDEP